MSNKRETYAAPDPQLQQELLALQNPSIRNKLSIEYHITTQLIRCFNALTMPDSNFSEQVMALAALMPSSVQDRLDNFLQNECTEVYEDYVYKQFCGINMGTPNHPILDENGEAYSPVKTTRTEVDYVKFLREIMTILEEVGLTWKLNLTNLDSGKKRPRLKLPAEIRNLAEERLSELVSVCNDALHMDISLDDFILTLTPEKAAETPTIVEGEGEAVEEDIPEDETLEDSEDEQQ